MSVSLPQEAPASEKEAAGLRTFSVLAVTALVSTIILIVVGSIVRVTGNGLGCPDWPLCHGQAIPPFLLSAWVEFIHRLFGGAVVLQVAVLIVLSWRWYRPDKWIFRTAIFATIVLAIQVLLGGIHVIYELPRWTGWIHTGVAMLVAGAVAVWVTISQPSIRKLGLRTAPQFKGSRLSRWTSIGAAATFILILTGSLVTRTGASLVCPSFPNCGLAIVPESLASLVTIQLIHRFAAFTVAFTIGLTLYYLLKESGSDSGVKRIAWILAALLAFQFFFGISNVLLSLPMWSRVLHLGTGATIWVFMVILSTCLIRGENQRIESTLA